jgi:uncharacterized protein YgiM (DUF1202 family)
MTVLAPRVFVLLTLAFLAACAPEVKQPAQVGSQAEPAQPAAPAPSTPPGPAPAPTAQPPAAPPPAATPPRPSPTPAREEPAPKAPAEAPKRLVVSVGQANLREKPDGKSRILQVLTKGAKLVIVSKGNQWYRVRLDNGREGWVAESVVTPAAD